MTDIRANYHTHTSFCDGANPPREMIAAALEKGFTALGFSGHVDPPQGVPMDTEAYFREIRALQAEYRDRITVLCGAELDSVLDYSVAKDAEYRIGSTHFVPAPGHPAWKKTLSLKEAEDAKDVPMICVDYRPDVMHAQCNEIYDGDHPALAADYFRFESMVVARTRPAFIGHFDLVTRFNDLPREEGGAFLNEQDPRYLAAAKDAMEQIIADGIPYFEVNCGAVNRNRKKEPYPCTALLKMLYAAGGEVIVSADAHDRALLDGGFADALHHIASCGFDHVNVLVREETDMPAKNTCQDARFTDGKQDVPLYWKQFRI